ncbi:MAG: glycosyltransferase family 4 protein [Actinobacteria bacterium]|nr:glycosyltransferase family 4 protein [Actinomycetota bacterium]
MNKASVDQAVLRVGLDARLVSGHPGGVQQVIIGLAHGLSRLEDTPEEYHFLVRREHSDWLAPYVSGRCRLLYARPEPGWKRAARRLAPFATPVVRAVRGFAHGRRPDRKEPNSWAGAIPVSDGVIEAAGIHVMHFPKQDAFLTDVPSLFHPHDLQHVHYPEFFPEDVRRQREVLYGAFCRQASMITVTSTWNRDDIATHYGLPPEKMSVIHLAPALSAYATPNATEIHDTVKRLGLPEGFILYPAQTWPHKNHLRLVEALHAIRTEHGQTIPLVCTSTKNDFYETIAEKVRELTMQDSVFFTGFVSPRELRGLYERARCVVVPTLFEAAGGFGPIAEAFLSGCPVACSNVTSLPEEVGDAALLFDPLAVQDIAARVWQIWTDQALRESLVARGRTQVARYDWVKTAQIFRAHYRRLGGFPLTGEDRSLMAIPPLY